MQPINNSPELSAQQEEGQRLSSREIRAVKNILLNKFTHEEENLPLMLVQECSEIPGEIVLRQRHLLPVSLLVSANYLESDDDGAATIIKSNTKKQIIDNAREIIATVATHYEQETNDLIGDTRKHETVIARHVAMYLIRDLTPLSYPLIARLFGRRDQSTARSGIKKVESAINDPNQQLLKNEVQELGAYIRMARIGNFLVVLSSKGIVSLPWVNISDKAKILGVDANIALDWARAEEGDELYSRFANTAYKLLQTVSTD